LNRLLGYSQSVIIDCDLTAFAYQAHCVSPLISPPGEENLGVAAGKDERQRCLVLDSCRSGSME
jgi:hypothetical protein